MVVGVTFEQTPEDVRDALIHFHRHGKYRSRLLRGALSSLFLAVWALLIALIGFATGERDAVMIFGSATAVFGFLAIVSLSRALRAPSIEAKQWLKDPQLRKRLLGQQTVKVSSDGVSWTHPIGAGSCAWAGISRIERGLRALYLYVGPTTVIAVPARAFTSVEDFDAFEATATQYLAG